MPQKGMTGFYSHKLTNFLLKSTPQWLPQVAQQARQVLVLFGEQVHQYWAARRQQPLASQYRVQKVWMLLGKVQTRQRLLGALPRISQALLSMVFWFRCQTSWLTIQQS